MKVYVTGLGIISALGEGVENNLSALQSGQTGIDYPYHLQSLHKDKLVAGEVKFANAELAQKAGLKPNKLYSRTTLLGLIAAQEAVASAGLSAQQIANTGLINGTSVGGMDISELHYMPFKKSYAAYGYEVFLGHDCGVCTEKIADRLGIKGHISTISTACSSSANAIMQAARLIRAGKVDRVIAGGTDALALFTLNGFNALKILDASWCKPFDQHRNGLNLGEGAAYLILESEEQAIERKAEILAEVIGYGNANDAYHQTASSPEGKGAYLAMKNAIEISGNDKLQIDYINVHGTGTQNNDLSESMALQMMFGENTPDYSSTKSFTGHTLGAAGGIEAVFSILALKHGLKFPNLNMERPMDVLAQPPLHQLKSSEPVRAVLSNSFGFGGNCTSLIFAR
ncbi:beta-ketoacyl-[acyl-carrier-protein] synthase family protein [Catalinimonas niigatensis]|uniref:beta-ketoacyl-[acyl-carrier-protein] synthase family protein n=1 Tax=Catalinimonas niigatensis TaxID=1397264 RepID=UPI0026654777|nr:beta-ketoacyl-[acyl-carrier-protein] synthase family protein [Catalinimonas niigatensis]WPP48765.1 beta-ketoacyl-[acyl-carrier-protein] synthase family protein [Catalinimonas niigatensis]